MRERQGFVSPLLSSIVGSGKTKENAECWLGWLVWLVVFHWVDLDQVMVDNCK